MDEDGRSHLGPSRELDRLFGRQVAPLGVVVSSEAQGALDEQQIGTADAVLDRCGRTGVAGIGQARPVRRLDDHSPGRDVVAPLDEPQAELPDLEHLGRVVLDGCECGIEEADPFTHGVRERVEARSTAGRQVDRQRHRRRFAPRIQIAQPDDVEVVVGVHVADHDRGEVVRIEHLLQVADHALAAIEQDRGRSPFDQESGGRRGRVWGCRAAAEHGQTEAITERVPHGGMLEGRVAGVCRHSDTFTIGRMLVGRPVLEALATIPFFAGLDPAALERVAAGMRSRRFKRGEVIFHIGDPGDALFVMVDGEVKISLPSETGEEAFLATLRKGDVFGELALLDGAPRSATATAISATETVVLPRDRFRELIATEAGVRDALLASIAGELRRLTTHVEELHFLDITGRLAARLVRLAQEGGTRLPDGGIRLRTNLTQGDLAAMVGCTRQSVNKLLGQFTDDGLIRLEREGIVITNVEGLTATSRR